MHYNLHYISIACNAFHGINIIKDTTIIMTTSTYSTAICNVNLFSLPDLLIYAQIMHTQRTHTSSLSDEEGLRLFYYLVQDLKCISL